MKQELQEELFQKYPKIFVERDLPKSETCMCWGIECGDGWFEVLDILCANLQFWTDHNDAPQVVATQVKEKFGGLCFYTNTANPTQRGMIRMAEAFAARTCEICGAKGTKMEKNNWYVTRCDEHAA